MDTRSTQPLQGCPACSDDEHCAACMQRFISAGTARAEGDDEWLAQLADEARAAGVGQVVDSLPFGFDHADQLLEPFCACGHVISRCDKSRRACVEVRS